MKRKGALSKSQPTCRIICGFASRYRGGIRLMPPVGTGRNWDMLALNESGAEYLRRVRRIVEDVRTEFVLPD